MATRSTASKGKASHAPMPTDVPAATRDLADALLSLKSREEVLRFLRDLCTVPELEALSHRWEIAQLLDKKVPYLEIAERLGASTTTVTRVAQWLRHGAGGYPLALERARKKKR